jgi:hypothetical protein
VSNIYLQPRQDYEDRYDYATVERCRMGERVVNQTFIEMDKKLPESEKKEHQAGWYLMYSKLYFGYVETVAAERRDGREKRIAAWMEADEKKDRRLANAKMKTPYCKTCGKDMEQISKDYMSRDRGGPDREDDTLFMFECKPCNKRIAVWQDGTEWEHKEPHCEKCDTVMKHSSSKSQSVYTSTDTCPKCGHIDTYEFDLNDKDEPEEPEDPYLELDRKRFCFDDQMESKYEQKFNHLLRMAKLELDTEEHVEHVDIYEAIKDIKQPKIAQLSDLLKEALAKGGYRDFKLGDPELGHQVIVGFSCLDEKPDRKEYDSKKSLQKLVNKTLGDTNWRLMSEGVDYRLGFLSGRLKAYEKEEDLKKLIEQRIKDGTYTLPEKTPAKPAEKDESKPKYEGMRMREAALVYFDKLLLGSMPAEITLKSGEVKPTSIPAIYGNMNPLLRVIIPMRDEDKSVPDFIRNYDFKMGPKDGEMPKVTMDSQGREIRLL